MQVDKNTMLQNSNKKIKKSQSLLCGRIGKTYTSYKDKTRLHSTVEGSCCKQGGQVKPGKLLSSQWPITHIDMPHLQHRYEVLVMLGRA